MTFFRPVDGAKPQLEGTTLVLPVVSVGSVPQLAVDLLLESPRLGLRQVGALDHAFCFPFAGPSKDGIATALEVFQGDGVTVVQQRSPVFKSREAQFVTALTQWISESGFKQVILLGSIDAAARTDAELSTPLVHIPAPSSQGVDLPRFVPRPPDSHRPLPSSDDDTVPHIPGGGLTRRILRADPPHTYALLPFCAEGDNRADAHFLVHALPLPFESELQEPASWSGLFGAPLSQDMYG